MARTAKCEVVGEAAIQSGAVDTVGLSSAEIAEMKSTIVQFDAVAPAFAENAGMILDARDVDGASGACTVRGVAQTCFQVVLGRPLKKMKLVEVDDNTSGLESLDILVSVHSCQGDERGSIANVDPQQLRSSHGAATTLHVLVLPRCPLRALRSTLLEWDVDPDYGISSSCIACLPPEIDRERCKALLQTFVGMNAFPGGTGYFAAVANDAQGTDEKCCLEALESCSIVARHSDHAMAETWKLTERGMQDIQLHARLCNPRPALRRRPGEPNKESTVFELLDYLDENGWAVTIIPKRALRRQCPPLRIADEDADALDPDSMKVYVRDGGEDLCRMDRLYMLALACWRR
eukprot:9053569-Alexandrium_andersonii.AAC.1